MEAEASPINDQQSAETIPKDITALEGTDIPGTEERNQVKEYNLENE